MRIEGSNIITDCPACRAEYVISFNRTHRHFEFPPHAFVVGEICPGTHYTVPETAVWNTIVCRIDRIQKMLKARIKETS